MENIPLVLQYLF